MVILMFFEEITVHLVLEQTIVPCFTVYNQQFTPQESSKGFFHGF